MTILSSLLQAIKGLFCARSIPSRHNSEVETSPTAIAPETHYQDSQPNAFETDTKPAQKNTKKTSVARYIAKQAPTQPTSVARYIAKQAQTQPTSVARYIAKQSQKQPTGVARYIAQQTHFTSKQTGVARYLAKQEQALSTGVSRYIARHHSR